MIKDGVINIDKPAGWTSHDVVAKIRAILKIQKVGHTGTLDPEATGVLPVCFGKGTKIVSFLMDVEKEYDVILRLGIETETQDATGKVVRSRDVPDYPAEVIDETLKSFVGSYDQIPPMYSAIKVNGRPLYQSARAGEVVERAPRRVTIREIRLHKIEGSDLSLSVVCSKGTYIRTLCSDIGAQLGVGGHLFQLRRVRSGGFHLSDSIPLDQFCELYRKEAWAGEVYSLNEVLGAFPAIWIEERYTRKIQHGAPVGPEGWVRSDSFDKGASLRLLDSAGTLLAMGTARLSSDEITCTPSPRGEKENVKEVKLIFKIETVLSETEESKEAVQL